MQHPNTLIALCSFALIALPCAGQSEANSDQYVTRAEYEKLLKELEAIKAQLARSAPPAEAPAAKTEVEALKAKVQDVEKKQQGLQSDSEETFKDYDQQLKGLNAQINAVAPGSTHMLLSGYGAATFQATRRGFGPAQPLDEVSDEPRPATTGFSANFNPIFLWGLSERALFEGELELEVEPDGGTEMMLEYAHLSYLLNDHVTVSAGKFLNPMNYFVERLHPAWINKLPDKPLAVYDGLLPESLLGAQIRGGVPLGSTKLEYAVFVANAPTLKMPDNDLQRGLMDFEEFSLSHAASGARVGFFPLPQLEIGYGIMWPNVGHGTGGSLHAVDLSYQQDSSALQGTVDLKAQWIWSKLDPNTIDVESGDVVPLPDGLSNHRHGGYVQLAYRPDKIEGDVLKNLEVVFRYDMLAQKNTPVGFDDRRYTVGLDYWLTPSTVLKTAYESDRQNGSGENGEAFWLQFALGF